MQYMLLIYEPEAAYEGEPGQALLMEIVGKHVALAVARRVPVAPGGKVEVRPVSQY